jgi:hypothetical protein
MYQKRKIREEKAEINLLKKEKDDWLVSHQN